MLSATCAPWRIGIEAAAPFRSLTRWQPGSGIELCPYVGIPHTRRSWSATRDLLRSLLFPLLPRQSPSGFSREVAPRTRAPPLFRVAARARHTPSELRTTVAREHPAHVSLCVPSHLFDGRQLVKAQTRSEFWFQSALVLVHVGSCLPGTVDIYNPHSPRERVRMIRYPLHGR